MSRRRSLAAFAVTALLFGGTFVAAKAGLEQLPPLLFLALRFDLGAAVLAGYAAVRLSRSELRPETVGDVIGILATGGLVVGLTNALLFLGQQTTTSGVAAIVFSLNPILTVAIAAWVLPNGRPTFLGVVGTLLGLAGIVVVAGPEAALTGDAGGVLLLAAGAVSIAVGTVLLRWAEPTLSSTARTVWGVPLAALLSHAASVAAGESVAAATFGPTALLAVAYVGVGSGAVAYLAYFALIDGVGPQRANLVFYVVPLVSTVGGWALLGESVGTTTLVGFGVVAAGFSIVLADDLGADGLRRLVGRGSGGTENAPDADPPRAD
ncbi:DMT family transporter [Halobaculum sp. MBLA0143]|uniref:DMT family transporter n=1 Tax=Halobaculum sp. MBLA0143 TaxID=3079933 RepID=UPI0035268C89